MIAIKMIKKLINAKYINYGIKYKSCRPNFFEVLSRKKWLWLAILRDCHLYPQ